MVVFLTIYRQMNKELQQLIAEQRRDVRSHRITPEIVANPVSRRGVRPANIVNFTSCKASYDYPSDTATAEEIAQTKEDSICPRCGRMIFLDPEGVLCGNCGFSY